MLKQSRCPSVQQEVGIADRLRRVESQGAEALTCRRRSASASTLKAIWKAPERPTSSRCAAEIHRSQKCPVETQGRLLEAGGAGLGQGNRVEE